MTIISITYHCPNSTMGETSPNDCQEYRSWLQGKIQDKYPDADVYVSANEGRTTFEADPPEDDLEIIEMIELFANQCWGECPWDWP